MTHRKGVRFPRVRVDDSPGEVAERGTELELEDAKRLGDPESPVRGDTAGVALVWPREGPA